MAAAEFGSDAELESGVNEDGQITCRYACASSHEPKTCCDSPWTPRRQVDSTIHSFHRLTTTCQSVLGDGEASEIAPRYSAWSESRASAILTTRPIEAYSAESHTSTPYSRYIYFEILGRLAGLDN